MDLKEEICKVAYEIFIKNGCIPNRDMDNWLEAERIVIEKYKTINPPDISVAEEAQKPKKTAARTKKLVVKTATTTSKKKAASKKAARQATPKKEK